MKSVKLSQGKYEITLQGAKNQRKFILERLFGSPNWNLYNANDVEINMAETKSGMMEVMKSWSATYVDQQSEHEFCTYA